MMLDRAERPHPLIAQRIIGQLLQLSTCGLPRTRQSSVSACSRYLLACNFSDNKSALMFHFLQSRRQPGSSSL